MEYILIIAALMVFAFCAFGLGYSYSRMLLCKRMMFILKCVEYEGHSDEFIRGVVYVSQRLHEEGEDYDK